MTEADMHI